MSRLTDLTALSRPVDFSYPSNVFAVVMSGIGFAIGILLGIADDKNTLDVAWLAVNASLTVFVAWALTRELDPDHNISAGIAAVLGVVGMIIWREPTNLIALYLVLVVMRGFVRTVGVPMRLLDLAGLVFGAGIVALTNAWLGFTTAAALLLDSILKPANQLARIFGVLAILVTVAVATQTQNFEWDFSADTPILIGVAVISLLYLWSIFTAPPVTSVGDETQQPLDNTRLKTAQILALVSAWAVYLWAGEVSPLLSLWCAMLAISGSFLRIQLSAAS